MSLYAGPAGFERSRERFDAVVGWLAGDDAAGLTHAELEDRLLVERRR